MKQYITKYSLWVVSVLIVFSMSSCVKNELPFGGGSPDDQGQKVLVELSFKVPPVGPAKSILPKSPESKSFTTEFFEESNFKTRSNGTSELYNLWAFQFNADGSINGTPQKVSDGVTMVNDMAILEVELTVATNQTLYLVVMGKKVGGDLSAVRSKGDLEAIPFDYLDMNNGFYSSRVTSEEDIPLAGSVSGVSIVASKDGTRGVIEYNKPEGFGGGIEIRRMLSRVMLKYKFDVTENKVEGIRLINVPMDIYLNSANPDALTYADLTYEIGPDEKADENGYYTAMWYIAPNMKGTIEGILTESDRYRKVESNVVYGSAPEFGTNFEIWSCSKSDRDKYMIHQVYVGKNNTNNFDVEANNYYNLRTVINSSDAADRRIRTYTAKQETYLSSVKIVNRYTVGVSGQEKSYFDVHPGSRPVIIYARGREVEVGIYVDEKCTQRADINNPAQNWLQLSPYPNYTEVARNIPNSLMSNIKAKIFLPTRLKYYLYCDDYTFNDDGTVSTTVVPSVLNLKERTLYVKITTTEIGVDVPKVLTGIYTMKQRQGVYCGLFGGELSNGQYNKAIVMDNVDEFAMRFDDVYPVKIEQGSFSSAPYFGYTKSLDYKITNDVSDYYKFYNGKLTTRDLAENPNNSLVATENQARFPEMRKVNGVIDLYQYDYYKTFAARFCYDLNRDKNGNGRIDHDPFNPQLNELEWYLPSPYQAIGIRAGFGKRPITANLPIESSYMTIMYTSIGVNDASCFVVGETSFGAGAGVGNDGKSYYGKVPRCIRDVNIPEGKKTTTQVSTTTIDEDTYVVIDLSDMPDGVVDRTKNNDKLYEDIELYTYSTTGNLVDPTGGSDYSEPVLDADGKQVMVKRVRKYSAMNRSNIGSDEAKDANFMMSRKFIVSPTNVWSDGDTKLNPTSPLNGKPNSLTSSWAVANGWLATANTSESSIPSKATMTGCYAYKGKSGKDPAGSWRTPSFQELSMIMLFVHEIEKTANVTGFEKLYRYTDDNAAYQRYASSTLDNSSKYYPAVGLTKSGIPFGASNETRTAGVRLRCIKDIE